MGKHTVSQSQIERAHTRALELIAASGIMHGQTKFQWNTGNIPKQCAITQEFRDELDNGHWVVITYPKECVMFKQMHVCRNREELLRLLPQFTVDMDYGVEVFQVASSDITNR